MAEPIKQTIVEGYHNYRSNLVLGVPALLSLIVPLMILTGAFFLSVVVYVLPLTGSDVEPTLESFIAPSAIIGIGAIAFILATSFFTASSIGMSIKAIETGKTELGDLFEYGSKKFFSVMVATLTYIIAAIAAAAVIFTPSILGFVLGVTNFGVSFLIIGTLVYIILIMGLIFSYTQVPTAIVADDLNGFEGIRRGFDYARNNKLKLFIFWAFYAFLSQIGNLAFGIVTGPIGYLAGAFPIVYLVLLLGVLALYMAVASVTLAPLYYLWLARMYVSKTTRTTRASFGRYAPTSRREQSSLQHKRYV